MIYKLSIYLLSRFNVAFSREPKLSILIYHRVFEVKDDLLPEEVDSREFEMQMRALSKYFHVMTLTDAMEARHKGVLPRNALCITFDDGYANNYTVAFSVLKKYQLPATFFISSGYIDGGIMWNDVIIELVRNTKKGVLDLSYVNLGSYQVHQDIKLRRVLLGSLLGKIKHLNGEERTKIIQKIIEKEGCYLPSNLMMTSDQVRRMNESGMEIGGHTSSHPILAKINSGQAKLEIKRDKEKLEAIIGQDIYSFAYPNGKKGRDYLDEHARLVKQAGYLCAVSTDVGITQKDTALFHLPRYTPWNKSANKFLVKLMLNVAKS